MTGSTSPRPAAGTRVRRRVRRGIRRNSRRLARVITDFEQDRVEAGQQRELRAMSGDLIALSKHFGTDKWGTHQYAGHYQHHFERFRDQEVNLLEIGVGGYSSPTKGGASLRTWKQFFPRGQIFGLDIHDKSSLQEPRIRIFRGDQSDPRSLEEIATQIGRLDIIIDDGSHLSPHVITTFETLFPLLAPNGLYVIEDLQTSYWPEWQGNEDRSAPHTSMAMVKALVDGLNYEEFVDDEYTPTDSDTHIIAIHLYHNMVILEKGRNAEGTRKRAILKGRYPTT